MGYGFYSGNQVGGHQNSWVTRLLQVWIKTEYKHDRIYKFCQRRGNTANSVLKLLCLKMWKKLLLRLTNGLDSAISHGFQTDESHLTEGEQIEVMIDQSFDRVAVVQAIPFLDQCIQVLCCASVP